VKRKLSKSIILIGFMGTGKTTVGQRVAKRLNWEQVDLDQEIERTTGKSIREIFVQEGERAFRALETTVLTEVLNRMTPQVVMTGGGVVTQACNVEMIREKGLAVALTAAPETILERLHTDTTRPLLAGDIEQNVRRLLAEREGLYDFAPVQLATDGKSVDEIVDELWAHPAFVRFVREQD
jgi:shikimate kinase